MDNVLHKFFCLDCKIFLFGVTVQRLATNVNDHMLSTHPTRFAGYTEGSIVRSACYTTPDTVLPSGPRPEYTKPWALTTRAEWGDAKKPPDITEDDIQMLKEHYIAW